MKFTFEADHKAVLEKLVKSGMTPVVILLNFGLKNIVQERPWSLLKIY